MADTVRKVPAKPQKKSSTDHAYAEIRRRIMENEFTPGSQWLELELAMMLGMSRTPVREALVRLQNESLLEFVPRHGVRILPLSTSDMKEIYDILASLEALSAERVARSGASDEDLAPLEAACREMSIALEIQDIDRWSAADEEFHLQIIRMSGNRRLAEIVLNCWDKVHRARRFTLYLRPQFQPLKSNEEHRAIIEALRTGDARAASEISRVHRERGGREQIEILTNFRIHQI